MLPLLLACTGPTPDDSGPGLTVAADVPRGALQLRFPLVERELFLQTVGVDHDPVEYDDDSVDSLICTNYDGRTFPWCYDGHRGSDYLLEGGFDQMDNGSATIVAAVGGTVVEVEDGHYDRCHGEVGGVDCDGNDGLANDIIIETTVACGTPLALVGSSGNSSQPHLHFQVEDAFDVVIDPYAGDYSQPESWWIDQGSATGLPGGDCPA